MVSKKTRAVRSRLNGLRRVLPIRQGLACGGRVGEQFRHTDQEYAADGGRTAACTRPSAAWEARTATSTRPRAAGEADSRNAHTSAVCAPLEMKMTRCVLFALLSLLSLTAAGLNLWKVVFVKIRNPSLAHIRMDDSQKRSQRVAVVAAVTSDYGDRYQREIAAMQCYANIHAHHYKLLLINPKPGKHIFQGRLHVSWRGANKFDELDARQPASCDGFRSTVLLVHLGVPRVLQVGCSRRC